MTQNGKQNKDKANAQKHKEDFNIEKYGRTFPRVAGDGWRVAGSGWRVTGGRVAG